MVSWRFSLKPIQGIWLDVFLFFFMFFLRVALRLLQDIYIQQEILHFAPHQAPRGVTLPPCRYIRDETMIAI